MSIAKSYIHEVSESQHRLVVLKSGTPAASPWFESRQVGKFQGIYFHVGAAGDLPSVFRASAVEHELL
jgi:hypothetical protein